MELQTHVCDDEVLLTERRESPFIAKRVLPTSLCAVTLMAAAGAGGHIAWNSSKAADVGDAISLHGVVVAGGCSNDGDDCRSTGCCTSAGSSCYRKNSHWASCNESCSQYRKWSHSHHYWHDTHERVWDCAMLVRQDLPVTNAATTAAPVVVTEVETVAATAAPVVVAQPVAVVETVAATAAPVVVAPPVAPACSFDGDDCRATGCCARAGSSCYRKHDHWASCNETCLPFSKWSHHHHRWVHTSEPVWDCSVLTEPIPVAAAPGFTDAPLPQWDLDSYKSSVYQGCTEDGHDCRYSQCCARRGSKCYVKNDHWASCNETCMPYTHWDGPHGHGSWKRTSYPVWECRDITTADNTHAVHPVPVSSR